jgi:hypothetical protein
MADAGFAFSTAIQRALARLETARPAQVHRLQVGLARLVTDQAPASAPQQLDLAVAFIEARAAKADLADAKQDLWTYVGSLACGCSIADSASAHAIMSCLETDEASHSFAALGEQVVKVLRCGVSETSILSVLTA